jgi:hypothetical protein
MQKIRPDAQNRIDRLVRQAAERFEIAEIKDIMYERVPNDDQLRYYIDTAEQVRDTSELRQFVADNPDEDELAQSLQTASQEAESAVDTRLEEVIDATLVVVHREIPQMVQTKTISDSHADKIRDEIEAYQDQRAEERAAETEPS